jgi:hypothetical protein
MPGLMRGMAKTAAVVGTATATRGAVNRRQANKNAAAYSQAAAQVQPQQAPQVEYIEVPAEEADPIEQLERLGALHAQGVLTDEEFAAQKAKILDA